MILIGLGSFSIEITCLAPSAKRALVRLPGPGPISMTVPRDFPQTELSCASDHIK